MVKFTVEFTLTLSLFSIAIALTPTLTNATGGAGNPGDPAGMVGLQGGAGKGASGGAGEGIIQNDFQAYTGGVGFALPLASVKGRAGLDLSVGMGYSSHVQQIANAENYEAQASWVGLGWTLSFGAVIANHNNTRNIHDDEYVMVLEDGSSHRLIQSAPGSNEFYLEDYRYWKISRVVSDLFDGVDHTWGWVVKREDGTVYRYGDMNDDTPDPSVRNASRWRVCWGNFSGLGSDVGAANESVYEYQWDLWKVSTPRGDQSITFQYNQVLQNVIKAAPGQQQESSDWQYTRASYLSKITLPNKRYVQFTKESRTDFERYFSDDLHQQFYDTLRLDYFEVFDSANVRSHKVDFTYSYSGGESKTLLTEVRTSDGGSTSLPSYLFSYRAADPNRLALEELTYPLGGKVTYSYDTVPTASNVCELAKSHYRFNQQTLTGFYRRMYWGAEGAGSRGWNYDDSTGVDAAVWNGYWYYLKGKWAYSASEGGENDVDADLSNRIFAYSNWQNGSVIARVNRGGQWDSTVLIPSQIPYWNSAGEWNWTMVGPDYVAVLESRQNPAEKVALSIFKLDPSQTSAPVGWRQQTIFLKNDWTTYPFDSYAPWEPTARAFIHHAGPGFFSMMFDFASNPQGGGSRTCIAALWNGSAWVEVDTTAATAQWVAGTGYMGVITESGSYTSHVRIYQSNDASFTQFNYDTPDRLVRPMSGPDYFIASAKNTSNARPTAYVMKYTGNGWAAQDLGFFAPEEGGQKEDVRRIAVAPDWFVLARHKDTLVEVGPGWWNTGWNKYILAYSWNGAAWAVSDTLLKRPAGQFGETSNDALWKMYVAGGTNVVATYYAGDHSFLWAARRMSSTWSAIESLPQGGQTFWSAVGGRSYVAVGEDDEIPPASGKAYYYSGAGWQDRGHLTNFGNDNGGGTGNYGSGFANSITSVDGGQMSGSWSLEASKWHSGYCGTFGKEDSVYYFVLVSRISDDRMGNVATTSYEYSGGILDPSGSSGRFRKVTVKGPYVTSPGSKDYTTTWFYNDWDNRASSSAPDLDNIAGGYHLDGLPIRVVQGNAVPGFDSNWTEYTYSVVSPKKHSFVARVSTTSAWVDGVESYTVYSYHDVSDPDDNGLPTQTTRFGSQRNGTYNHLVEQITYAHEAEGAPSSFPTSAFKDSNAIIFPFEKRLRTDDGQISEILSKSRIDYAAPSSSGWTTFVPTGTWAYRLNNSVDTFLTSSGVNSVDGMNPVRSVDANGVVSSTKYGCAATLPIAGASNADFTEWAVCNFEALDKEPASYTWFKFQYSDVSTSTVFTGQRSGYATKPAGAAVVATSATYNGDPSADSMVFDAWLKSNVATGKAGLVCRVFNSPTNVIFKDSVSHPGDGGATWQHLQLVVPLVGLTIHHVDFEVRIYETATTGQWIYVDDCRISPVQTLVTTRCYDSTRLTLLAEAGPDNIPTKYTYDALGRLIATKNYKDELLESRFYSYSREKFGSSFVVDSNYVRSITYRGSADADSTVAYAFMDGFGRTIQSRVRSTDTTEKYIVAIDTFDVKGRVAKSFKPFYSTGQWYSSSAEDACYAYYDGSPGPDCQGKPFSQSEYYDDPMGRIKRVASAGLPFSLDLAHTVRYTYGANTAGEISGYTTANELRKTTVTDEDGRISYTFVDKLGRTIGQYQDQSGTKIGWTASYDPLGRMLSRTDARGLVTTWVYDALGQVLSVDPPDADTYYKRYDKMGRLRFDKDPKLASEGQIVYYKYDPHGRRIEWGKTSGGYFAMQDSADFPTFPSVGKEFTNSYGGWGGHGGVNARGKLVRTSDRTGGIWRSSVYDAFGRISTDTIYIGPLDTVTIGYSYNRAGMLTQEQNVDDSLVNYAYDRSGRILSVSDGSSVLAEYDYWPTGAIRTTNFKKDGTSSNIQTVDYAYNSRDWLRDINSPSTMGQGESDDRFSLSLSYNTLADAAGIPHYTATISRSTSRRQNTIDSQASTFESRFGYDVLGRMTRNDIYVNGVASTSELFAYDNNSNVTSRSGDGLPYEVFCYESTSNRLTSKGFSCPGSTSYTYDLDGQLRTRGANTFTFSWRNLLAAYEVPHGSTPNMVYFEYDSFRQRVKSNYHYWYCDYSGCNVELSAGQGGDSLFEGAALSLPEGGGAEANAGGGGGPCLYECADQVWVNDLTYFIFDQFGRVVAEYSGANLARKYYYAGSSRFAMRDVPGNSKLYYTLADQVSSARVVVSGASDAGAGTIVARYNFFPYGQTHDASVTTDTKYSFGGHRYQADGGMNLYYMGARFYDASAMRFISMDPSAQFSSPYIYSFGNPTSGTDPDGRWFWTALAVTKLLYSMNGAENAGQALLSLWSAGASMMASTVVSEAFFTDGLKSSLSFDAFGLAKSESFSPLEDVAFSAIGGAFGGVAGTAFGQFGTMQPITASSLAKGAGWGALYGAAASDPVGNLVSGRGFKTAFQRYTAEGDALAEQEIGAGSFGTNYQPEDWVGFMAPYDCVGCMSDIADFAPKSTNSSLRKGYRHYGVQTDKDSRFHVEAEIGQSRGVKYTFGKLGTSEPIYVQPEFVIRSIYPGPVTIKPWSNIPQLRGIPVPQFEDLR